MHQMIVLVGLVGVEIDATVASAGPRAMLLMLFLVQIPNVAPPNAAFLPNQSIGAVAMACVPVVVRQIAIVPKTALSLLRPPLISPFQTQPRLVVVSEEMHFVALPQIAVVGTVRRMAGADKRHAKHF